MVLEAYKKISHCLLKERVFIKHKKIFALEINQDKLGFLSVQVMKVRERYTMIFVGPWSLRVKICWSFLPKEVVTELTVNIDESRTITVNACFPYLDDFISDKKIETGNRLTASKKYLEQELKKAQRSLEILQEQFPELDLVKVEEIRNELNENSNQLDRGGSDSDTRDQVLGILRENLKKIDKLESDSQWPKGLKLLEGYEKLKSTNDEYGNNQTTQIIEKMDDRIKQVIEKQDIQMARDLSTQISGASDVNH